MTGGSTGTVIVGALIMAALVYKAIDLVKYVVALFGNRSAAQGSEGAKPARLEAVNGLITLAFGCAVGIGVVMLMVHTSWINEIKLGASTLKGLSAVEQVVLGLAIASLAAVLFDFKKAFDGTDTASTPKLLPGPDRVRRERLATKMSSPKHAGDETPSPKVLEEAGEFVQDTRAYHDKVEEAAKHLGEVLAEHHSSTDGGPPSP